MDNLAKTFKNFLLEACKIAQNEPIPSKLWTKITRESENNTSYTQFIIPDFDRIEHSIFKQLLESKIFASLIESANTYKPLFDFVTKDVRLADYKITNLNKLSKNFVWNMFLNHVLNAYFKYNYEQNQNLKFSKSSFDFIFKQFLEDLKMEEVKVINIFPLIGRVSLGVDEVRIDKNLCLRKVTDNEIDRWFNPTSIIQSIPLDDEHFTNIQLVIESSFTYDPRKPKPTINNDTEYLFSYLLSLIINKPVSIPLIDDQTNNVLHKFCGKRWLNTTHPFTFPTDNVILEVDKIVKYWQKLQKHPSKGMLFEALKRWSDASQRLRIEDALVDYWIALESLFSTKEEKSEITFRLSLRIAGFLDKKFLKSLSLTKKEFFTWIKKVSYDYRCQIVHGSFKNTPQEIEKLQTATHRTKDCLRKSLLQIIDTDEEFIPSRIEEQFLLSSTSSN